MGGEGHIYFMKTKVEPEKSRKNRGRGWSNTIPDPSGRKDRHGNPVYIRKSDPKPQPKSKLNK